MKVILNDTLKRANKSRYQLAKETGISASILSNLCNNKTTAISFSNIEKICKAVPCTPNDIFLIEDKNNNIKANIRIQKSSVAGNRSTIKKEMR